MFDLYHQWMHHTFSNVGTNYWFPFFMPGLLCVLGLIFLSCWHTDEIRFKDEHAPDSELWAAGVRAFVVGVLLDLAWPWVVVALVPIGVLCLLGFGVWSFAILVPSKAERIAKRQTKKDELQARVAALRSE